MNEWEELYQSKKRTLEEAAKLVESGDRFFIGGTVYVPTALVNAVADRAVELENVDLIDTMLLEPIKPITSSEYCGRINCHTLFLGGAAHKYYKEGNIKVNSSHFSRMYDVLRDVYKVNGVMIECAPMDEEGYLHLGCVGTVMAGKLVETGVVDKVILQVNHNECFTKGRYNKIHISQVTALIEWDHPLATLPQSTPADVDHKIAEHIIPMIPDNACIQIGIGGLSNAVGYGLRGRKNLSCYTEMFSDSMMELRKCGAMTGKMEACFALGSQELYDFAAKGEILFYPMDEINDFHRISAIDHFVSINSCLMVDLTGQVCSESIGHRQYSCVGGQVDFVRGARASKGGKSFLCLASTMVAKDGTIRSKISLNLPAGAVVTTPRSDVMYIVTEYGIADLADKPIEDRVNAMISIAHPDFRDQLRQEAVEAGLLRK